VLQQSLGDHLPRWVVFQGCTCCLLRNGIPEERYVYIQELSSWYLYAFVLSHTTVLVVQNIPSLSPPFLILSLSPSLPLSSLPLSLLLLLSLSPSFHHYPPSLPPSLHLPSLPPSLSSSSFSGSLAVGYADFGRGTGLILLSNVRCQGSEDNLSQCPHGGVNQHRCNHEEDVGVICVGECAVDQCPFGIQCTDTVDKFKSCKCCSFHIN